MFYEINYNILTYLSEILYKTNIRIFTLLYYKIKKYLYEIDNE